MKSHVWTPQYLRLAGVHLLVSISYSMVSTIMAQYAVNLGMSVAVAGSLTGVFSIASMLARPATGFINDHVGRRRILTLATAVMGLCTLAYAAIPGYTGLLAARILHGAAFAFSSTVNMAVIPSLVPKERITEGVSYFGVVTSLGIAVGPSLGLHLVSLGGYSLNFVVSAGMALVAVALAFTLPPMEHDTPRVSGKCRIHLEDIIAKECLIYTVVDVTIAASNGLENSLLALLGTQAGIANIGWYFTISAVTLCLARLLLGRLADRKGVGYAIYLGLVLIAGGFLLLWRAHAAWQFALAAVVKTVGIGLARPAIQAACLRAVPANRRGSASSTYYIGSDIGQGTAPVLGGYLVDITGKQDYGAPFAIFTLPLALSGLLYALYTKRGKGEAVL